MLETHASQTATKESSGRNTRAHRWQKVLGGRHDSLRFATHRWHWKRVPGPSISAISSFFITKWRQSVPGPDVPAPFLLTHRWRRILGSSVCTANTNARPSDNITKPAAAAAATAVIQARVSKRVLQVLKQIGLSNERDQSKVRCVRGGMHPLFAPSSEVRKYRRRLANIGKIITTPSLP